MCHNIIDGRFHSHCQHFEAMFTRTQDCLEKNCIFSQRHVHDSSACRGSCKRLMALPVRNPIRISDIACAGCLMRARVENIKCQSPA